MTAKNDSQFVAIFFLGLAGARCRQLRDIFDARRQTFSPVYGFTI
jgi:hypothetical protein